MKAMIFVLFGLFLISACASPPAELTQAAVPTVTRTVPVDAEVFEIDVITAGYDLDAGELVWDFSGPQEMVGVPNDIPFRWLGDGSLYYDFILGFDVEWGLNPDVDNIRSNGCGVVFRDQEGKTGELLALVVQEDELSYSWNIEHWTPDGYLGSLVGDAYFLDNGVIDYDKLINPDKNHLVLVADGNTATVFANGGLLDTAKLPAHIPEGGMLMFPRADTGSTTCTFSNIWIWEINN